jgi:hypothetical protein
MKRRLMALNLVLIAILGALEVRFQQVRNHVRERETRVLGQKVPAQKYPPLPAAPAVPPVVAANYLDVAQRMVMARDRNPAVIIDPEPVKVKPPMPALPVAQGLMMIGEPAIIMTEKPGAQQRTYHKGDKIGAFKLLAFDADRVVLDWDGEKVERKLEDLLEKTPAPSASGGGPAAPAAAAAPPPSAASAPTPLGPGVDIGGGYHGCQANDSTPSGTVQNGMRKVEVVTPFGKSCRWEPVK